MLTELLGVLSLGEAEDVHVGAVSIEGMPSRAECEVLAEEVNGHIVAAGTAVCRKRYLVRPVAVDDVLAELSSTIEHAVTGSWSPPALTQLTGRGEPRRSPSRRAALCSVAALEQKENKPLHCLWILFCKMLILL